MSNLKVITTARIFICIDFLFKRELLLYSYHVKCYSSKMLHNVS